MALHVVHVHVYVANCRSVVMCLKLIRKTDPSHGPVDREVDFLICITIAVWVRISSGEKCPEGFMTYIYRYIILKVTSNFATFTVFIL